MKKIIHYTLLIVLINACFLFSPKPTNPKHFCGDYFNLGKHAGFAINCDAYTYVGRAMRPYRLMEQNEVRQSRPLYVLMATVTGYSIYYLSYPAKSWRYVTLEESVYLGYVVLNFLLLLASLYLFDRLAHILTNDKMPYVMILLLAVFIVSNNITKAFFWTAHQQMFAFFTPLLSIYLSIGLTKDSSLRKISILSFVFGSAMLVYGNFTMCFAVMMLYLVYQRFKSKQFFTVPFFGFMAMCGLLFLAPTMIWISILKMNDIIYYNHEVAAYRQLIWVWDTLSQSPALFATTTIKYIGAFVTTLNVLYLFVLFLLISVLARWFELRELLKWNAYTKMIGLNLGCFAIFFAVLGFYDPRLTFTLMPALLCLTIANMTGLFYRRPAILALGIVAGIWHLVHVCSYGPFS